MVDTILQNIANQQTNGIPQGNVLMDFIAELVLGYADYQLSQRIKGCNELDKDDFHILRYRDDYKIFTKDKSQADKIGRMLSDVLLELGLQLNPEKTFTSENIITDSQKRDKLYWRDVGKRYDSEYGNYEQRILQIHMLSEKFPNSGSVGTELSNLHSDLEKMDMNTLDENFGKMDLMLMASVVTDIACKSPRVYPEAIGILGILATKMNEDDAAALFKNIIKKFSNVSNSEYFDVWLQRLPNNLVGDLIGDNKLCEYVKQYAVSGELPDLHSIWKWRDFDESEGSEIDEIMLHTPIIDIEEYKNRTKYPKAEEIKPFFEYW